MCLRRQKGQLPPCFLFIILLSCDLGQPYKAISHNGITAGKRAVIGFFWPQDKPGVFCSIQIIAASFSVCETALRLLADLFCTFQVFLTGIRLIERNQGCRVTGVIVQKSTDRAHSIPTAHKKSHSLRKIAFYIPIRMFRRLKVPHVSSGPVQYSHSAYHK